VPGDEIRPGDENALLIKTMEEQRMTTHVSRRSLLALGAGLGATTLMGGSALARAPQLGTQSPYFHRMKVGDAEVTVVSDGPRCRSALPRAPLSAHPMRK
jgi:hypothetical protein